MLFDTPEQALLLDIKFATKSFQHAPPPKSHTAAMSDWKERLAGAQWDLQRREPQGVAPSAPHMPLNE
jgi:hypothetical protein